MEGFVIHKEVPHIFSNHTLSSTPVSRNIIDILLGDQHVLSVITSSLMWLSATGFAASRCHVSSQRSRLKQSLVSEGKKSCEDDSPALSFCGT